MIDPKVIVALDYASAADAFNFVDKIDSSLCNLKVGKELFTIAGPDFVKELVKRNFRVFLDLKFHDIPNTVLKACEAASDLGVWLVDVHTTGGSVMMEMAARALKANNSATKIIGVTVLTSMDEAGLKEIGFDISPKEQVLRLAALAKNSGLDGVVASAQESSIIRQSCGDDFLIVTPGIRPAGSDIGDQSRIMTPAQAIEAGSDYLVIGRPITKALDPVQALTEINQQIQKAG